MALLKRRLVMSLELMSLELFATMEEIFNNTTEIKDKIKKLDEENNIPKVFIATDNKKRKNRKNRKDIIALVLSSVMINGKEVFVISNTPINRRC
jgi:replicative DNA helicase